MRLSGFFIYCAIIIGWAVPATTHSAETKKETFYKCTKGEEIRWIRLYKEANGKCKTVYSKNGNAEDVSEAKSYSWCEEVLNNVKKNLEKGGYSCEERALVGSLDLEVE